MSNITGTAGNDTLSGTAGYDYLDGGAGADTMGGLAGDDVYAVDDAGDVVSENPGEGNDRVNSTIDYTLGANLEALWLVGTAPISGTGNALDNVLWGNGADNALDGLAGDDILDGGAGADHMAGGSGDDTYWVDDAGDTVTENPGAGSDTVKSSLPGYTLGSNVENLTLLSGAGNIDGTGNAQNNTLQGNEGDNVLTGGAGNDSLDGGAGADTLVGGSGDDSYRVDNTGDVVTETADEGNDTVTSTLASYTLTANVENLILGSNYYGTESLDGSGNALANTLRGNSGANVLDGGAGNDTLIGGTGNDTLIGGTGDDVFYFSTDDTGTDRITDLSSGDVIEVCGALFLSGPVTLGSGATVGSGEVQLSTAGGQTLLHIGTDATPGADLLIVLDGSYDPGNFTLSGFDIRYDTNHTPALNDSLDDQQAAAGSLYTLQLPTDTFTDADHDTLSYSAQRFDLDEGFLPLPAWLQFDAATRTFSGTPAHDDLGSLLLLVTATDTHGASTSGIFTLTVDAGQSNAQTTAPSTPATDTTATVSPADTTSPDTLHGTSANDALTGDSGVDTIDYTGAWGSYTITRTATGYTLSGGSDGTDTLTNVERLQFADKKIALDLAPDGNAGESLEFIGMVAHSLLGTPTVLGKVLAVFDQGDSMHAVCQLAIDIGLIHDLAGSSSDLDLARLVYRNVIGSEATDEAAGALAAYMQGSGGTMSQADFLATVAQLELNQQHIDLVGLQSTGVEYI